MAQLAGSIGLGDPDALGSDVVVRRVVSSQGRINAWEQQGRVWLAVHRQK